MNIDYEDAQAACRDASQELECAIPEFIEAYTQHDKEVGLGYASSEAVVRYEEATEKLRMALNLYHALTEEFYRIQRAHNN